MKKLLALLLVACILTAGVTIVGCGDATKPAPASKDKDKDKDKKEKDKA